MGEETSDTMNLDLNLGLGPEGRSGSSPTHILNLDDWVDDVDRIREVVRLRSRHRHRWRQVPSAPETRNLPMELDQLLSHSANGTILQTGEGNVSAEERINEVPKTCENNNVFLVDEVSEKKDDDDKGSGTDGSFFDCNICLDLARDPVVTSCGHLFCWSCIYRWLHVHSDAKECPVCKGEVTIKNVTPIYGRGNSPREPEEGSSLKIPLRPQGRRVESLRQTIQRTALNFPVEEMIRRLGSRFDLSHDLTLPPDGSTAMEPGDRANSLINRILTSRGIRGEQNMVSPPPGDVDVQSGSHAEGEAQWLHSLLLRRQAHAQAQAHRASTISSSLSSTLSSAERLLEAYFRNLPERRNQEQPSSQGDDRDSFSSIAAVLHSESQTDTDMMSLSTSSSRRRNDSSRVSDVDSGDSRAPRRRRLN